MNRLPGKHRSAFAVIVLVLSGCAADASSCGYDKDFKFPEIRKSDRTVTTAAITEYLESHPELFLIKTGRGRLFCEVTLIDLRDKNRTAYGRAVCSVFVPSGGSVQEGEGLGEWFRVELTDGGSKVNTARIPEGMGSDYGKSIDEMIPDDLDAATCQAGFPRGEGPTASTKRLRARATNHFASVGSR